MAAVADLDPAEAARAVDELAAAELVTPGPRPAFVHPLVAQAVADRMPTAERQRAHRTAAAELAADGAPPEAVAAHLLEVSPLRDAWVVERLREAARDALAKGAPQPAVDYLSRRSPSRRRRRCGSRCSTSWAPPRRISARWRGWTGWPRPWPRRRIRATGSAWRCGWRAGWRPPGSCPGRWTC